MRRPWLRNTRLLAGAPTASASAARTWANPPGPEPSRGWSVRIDDEAGVTAALAAPTREGPFDLVLPLAAAVRADPLVAGAGSPWTLGDPMPGAW